MLVAAAFIACGPVPVSGDAGLDDDAGDAGLLLDAGSSDAGGSMDAGTQDAGVLDAGLAMDAGTRDAGLLDAGSLMDAGNPDAGPFDAGASDSGVSDAGSTDSGTSDAGGALPDAGRDSGTPAVDAGSICGRCTAYGPVRSLGQVGITELSGLAASQKNPGILYAHDDSGGPASLTIMSTLGATVGQLVVMGSMNVDWEDLALGPCPTGSCLYIGEIGDNGASGATPTVVYRVTEPTIAAGTMPGMLTATAERLELQYPNNAHFDAETLLVHPTTGDVYIVSKHTFGTKSSAYKATAPLSSTSLNVMTRVAMLAVPDGLDLPLTGGDIDPCGNTLLLRSYSTLYQFVLPANATSFDAIFTAPFTRVPVSPFPGGEAQGEAVCWRPGGGYYTASEGQAQQLHFVGCL